MSDATGSQISAINKMIDEESLTDDEREAADRLLELFVNSPEIGSHQLRQMQPLLSEIDQKKRARHGLGWKL